MNAWEVMIARTAKDDADRQMKRSQLYAPPREKGRPRRVAPATQEAATPAAGGGISLAAAQAMAAEIAAEDASLTRR